MCIRDSVRADHVLALDGIELAERAHEKASRGEQNHAHSELRDDERLLKAVSSLPRGQLASHRGERRGKRALIADARDERENDGRQDAYGEANQEHLSLI